MPRNPRTIAAELTAMHAKASLAFVPLNVRQALDLTVEFVQSVADTLDAAGLLPTEPAPDAAPSSTDPQAGG